MKTKSEHRIAVHRGPRLCGSYENTVTNPRALGDKNMGVLSISSWGVSSKRGTTQYPVAFAKFPRQVLPFPGRMRTGIPRWQVKLSCV